MQRRIFLTSFYGSHDNNDAVNNNNSLWRTRQERLNQSALTTGGVTDTISWNAEKLMATDFAQSHRDILSLKRGFGYWMWKPFIILEALNQAGPDDYVLYHDVGTPQRGDITRGYTIDRDLAPLIRWAEDHGGIFPGVYMPHHGKAKHWTKRDCFILMDCEGEAYWESPQIQAGYNLWKNTERSRRFLTEWLMYCTDARILTDAKNTMGQENFPGFKEHRHDQSIFTNLCIKNGVTAFGSPTEPLLLHRSFNTLIRHARFAELQKEKKNILRTLAKSCDPVHFDRSWARWVELFFCERRFTSFSILLVGNHQLSIWRQYAAAAEITHLTDTETDKIQNDQLVGNHYDLVIINLREQPALQFAAVTKLFQLLKVDGLLVCGQVDKSWDKLPQDHVSSLALMRDFWRNKSILHPMVNEDIRQHFNDNLLMAFTAWNQSGEHGNVYFIKHHS